MDKTQAALSDGETLLACPNPWCDGENGPPELRSYGGFQIICQSCDLEGPEELSKEAARQAWNTRAMLAYAAEAVKGEREACAGVAEERARPNYAEFADALLIAAGMYTDVELAFWLNAPQPLLEMWTPIQLLARGDADKLLRVLQALEDGVYV